MTRSALVAVSWLLTSCILLLVSPCHARPIIHKGTLKGQRVGKKGWRRRAQDYTEAKEVGYSAETKAGPLKTTFVTNPSSLKGKGGKGGQVTYTEEDENGRTTIVVNCDDHNGPGRNLKGKRRRHLQGRHLQGKGKGKAGKGVVKAGEYGTSGPGTKSIPHNICDGQGTGEMTGGGWYGGSGEGDGGSGAVVEGGVEVVVIPPDDGSDYPEYENGQVLESNLGLYACARIAAGNAPTIDALEKVTVTLDVIHEIEPNVADEGSAGILSLMRADLQDNVAPVIADCLGSDGTMSPSGRPGNSGMGGSGSGSGVSAYGNGTLVTNVNFDELTGDAQACTQDYKDFADQFSNPNGKCMLTTIPVDMYYDGTDTSDFEERVQTAIDEHNWNVPGLMMTSTVHKNPAASVTAIEANQVAESDTIGPAGYLTIAAAALVLLLLALMLVRRKRRDEMVKHVSLEDDDNDTYLRDIEGDSQGSPMAEVVDGESVATGWTGANTHFRNASGMMLENTETRPAHQDVHVCSSATCEVCERNRQAGVQFIPSSTNLEPPTGAPLPPDSPRQYTADDTVSL